MRELYISGRDRMKQSGIENPGLEASLLLSKVLDVNILDFYRHPERVVGLEKVGEFNRLLERRIKREPIAYILGEKEFYSRSFLVTPHVLIPRPETEVLVEEALKVLKEIDTPLVADAGTGSGCIAVTVACEYENANVIATDISNEALSIARENAKRYSVDERISFVHADFLNSLKEESFDAVLSNPPYVATSDFQNLQMDVREFEPALALLGGEDGLDCVRKIAYEAGNVLKSGGWCIVEIGEGQSKEAVEIFDKIGFEEISTLKDLSGIERVVKARWKKW